MQYAVEKAKYRYRYNGKEISLEVGSSVYDYGARLYNSGLARWMSVDPLAGEFPDMSPYAAFNNNPLFWTDPTGMAPAPIYSKMGKLLGTDNQGLKGKAIVMDKSKFSQGMKHEDALKNNEGIGGLENNEAKNILIKSYEGLPSRPDYDGHLTLSEANKWYKEGNGQPLFTSLAKIDLSGILSLGENYVGEKGSYNLLLNSNSVNDGLVYGSITLKRYSDHQVRAYADEYNFEMHNARNPLNWPRNAETLIGRKVAGEGQKFDINIYGSKKLTPILPWIK